MTSRERVIKTLNHLEPDRVPVDLGGTVTNTGIARSAHSELLRYLEYDQPEPEYVDILQQLVNPDERVLDRFRVDVYGLGPSPPDNWKLKIEEGRDSFFYTDEWGIRCRMPRDGYYFDRVEYPLGDSELDLDRFNDYAWPNPRDAGRRRGVEKKVKELYQNTDYALCFKVEGAGVFEQSVAIRGNENFYVDLIANPKLATAIMDKMLEFYIGFWEEMLPIVGAYVQVIKIGDDLGMQNGPLISPDLYRSLIKPRERELISFIKKRTDAKIYFHSCGSVYEFIPDLIEIGVDVLNPIQVSAKDMVTKRLKQEFGERLSFWGAVDTQQVLPFGSQEDVVAEVRKRIGDLAPGGGYILSSVHNIQAKVPPENIAAMFDAAFKYGEYPIQTPL